MQQLLRWLPMSLVTNMTKTIEITFKAILELDESEELDIDALVANTVAAAEGDFAKKMRGIGDFTDLYVQKIEERNVIYFVDEQ